MKIIFNADDYGYSKGVNLGIIEAYENGLVRSCTMMTNTSGFEHGVKLLERSSGLKTGLHLVLTHGFSLGAGYKTIISAKGKFLTKTELEKKIAEKEIDLNEVEKEYTLQIEKMLAAKINITHIDGHHHTHILPGIMDVTLRLARKYGINAIRMCNLQSPKDIKTIAFNDTFFGEKATVGHLEYVLSRCNENTEFMCHPAYLDSYLYNMSSYSLGRIEEVKTLTSKEAKELIKKLGISLASYTDL
ncbi:MAG: carbohydrate deacetylase [Defluviitaleaceae bacterium]|nr:carbohydrate deacetylase [Defluviitaleaceae bacterium]